MVASSGEWRRWYSDTEWVVMYSGFHRAPEIMAWHAATLSCIAVYLLARKPGLAPVWLVQAAWGLACVAFSGRRKMFILVILFVGLFLLFTRGRWRGRVLVSVVLGSIGVALLLLTTVDERYLDAAGSGFTRATPRVATHTYTGPLWLITIVGPFGYGIGTKTQGSQHLTAHIDTPLVEGGFEKIMVELGFAGTAAALFLAITLFRVVFRMSRRMLQAEEDTTTLAALLAFLVANLMAFTVAYQVYGDPLIGILLGFSLGLILSASRLIRSQNAARSQETGVRKQESGVSKKIPPAQDQVVVPRSSSEPVA
jgi:hypothetical protein